MDCKVFFFKIVIFYFPQLTCFQRFILRCGKCPLSTVKELFSSVDALLKVTNLKRFDNQSQVVRCRKYTLSTAKKRFQLICRAIESNYFPQLRSIFYKAVRCGKCILSAANRGLQRGALRKVKIINS